MPIPENVKTFAANLSKAIRDHEVVRIGGGEFNREELMEVLKALTASGCVVELLPVKAFNTALKVLEAIRASNPELIADNMPPGWGMNKLRDAFSGEVLPGATMSEIKVVETSAFTVLCRQDNVQTTHVGTYHAESQDHAVDLARAKAADDWSCEPEDIQILGVLLGAVEVLEWDDKVL